MSAYREMNFDGLVGPSHHYGGLSFGNRASMAHGYSVSNPRAAALQGLEKMRALAERGFPQAVLPPVRRPNLGLLRNLGFGGSPVERLRSAAEAAPTFLSAAWSASSMWTANAATVFPSLDTADKRLRFVPANLSNQLHRSTEAAATRRILASIFAAADRFAVEAPLWRHGDLGDEGAANHSRFFADPNGPGLHFFVFGRGEGESDGGRFPARQTEAASRAVARLGRLEPSACFFARQSSEAIDAGVFHNDVIAVGQGDFLFCHACAYERQEETLEELRAAFARRTGGRLRIWEVPSEAVSLDDAVGSYLFNSQLIPLPDGRRVLLVPAECMERPAVSRYLQSLLADPTCPIGELMVRDLRQSMRNGGGPACLRLRVYLSDREEEALRGRVRFDGRLYRDLKAWVERHYREALSFEDLCSAELLESVDEAFSELAEVLELPGLYESDED